MLLYVEKLTLRPWEMVEEDVITLREVGFGDAAILDINQVTGYYAYVNRLADGLGVELEPYWAEVPAAGQEHDHRNGSQNDLKDGKNDED